MIWLTFVVSVGFVMCMLHCMRDVLHWLPLRQSIEFRVAPLVWHSLIGQAPA